MGQANAWDILSDLYAKKEWAGLGGEPRGETGTQSPGQGAELFRTWDGGREALLDLIQLRTSTTDAQEIKEQMRQLQSSIDRLTEVVEALNTRIDSIEQSIEPDSAFATMLASEQVLRRDWESPEEEEAWADL